MSLKKYFFFLIHPEEKLELREEETRELWSWLAPSRFHIGIDLDSTQRS